jgi:tRNA uridine 5-carbamoylmethylation protein Kti12
MKKLQKKQKKETQPTLHIMRGLPGSGKSTISNEILRDNREFGMKTFRLNRDSIRKMLYPEVIWNPQFEEVVKIIELDCTRKLLSLNFNVIIDDTNLGDLKLYQEFKNIQVHDFRHVDVEECLRRNEGRRIKGGNFCSPDIIVKLARQHKLI